MSEPVRRGLQKSGLALLIANILILVPPALGVQERARAIAATFTDAPIVLHVRDAKKLRLTPQYDVVRSSLNEFASFDAIRTSWASLSKSLGWDEDETFDRLLGESFAVIVEDPDQPDAWTVICEVTKQTTRHVGGRQRLVPRAQIAGVPVFGVEGDSLSAAMVNADDASILILTRDRSNESFARAIGLARRSGAADAPTPTRLPEGQIALALRDFPTPDTDLAAGATQRPHGWAISTKLRSATISDQLASDMPKWSPPKDSASKDLLFEVHLPLAQFDQKSFLPLAQGTLIRDDRPGLDEFGPIVSIFARAAETGDLAVTLAVEAKGRRRSALKADAIISALIGRLGAGRIAPPEFDGLVPDAMRVSEAIGLDPFIRERAMVSWAYPMANNSRQMVVIDAAPLSDSGNAAARIEDASRRAGQTRHAQARAYATTGWIRVADAIEQAPVLRELILGERTPPPFVHAMERLSWRIWRESHKVIRGEFDLVLRAK